MDPQAVPGPGGPGGHSGVVHVPSVPTQSHVPPLQVQSTPAPCEQYVQVCSS